MGTLFVVVDHPPVRGLANVFEVGGPSVCHRLLVLVLEQLDGQQRLVGLPSRLKTSWTSYSTMLAVGQPILENDIAA